ncbi:hypothetical protein G4Q83_03670 [Xanthomonas theicola]|nr:hypothetical protein G4Q83_03670 [Xanthomonas theicola]
MQFLHDVAAQQPRIVAIVAPDAELAAIVADQAIVADDPQITVAIQAQPRNLAERQPILGAQHAEPRQRQHAGPGPGAVAGAGQPQQRPAAPQAPRTGIGIDIGSSGRERSARMDTGALPGPGAKTAAAPLPPSCGHIFITPRGRKNHTRRAGQRSIARCAGARGADCA